MVCDARITIDVWDFSRLRTPFFPQQEPKSMTGIVSTSIMEIEQATF